MLLTHGEPHPGNLADIAAYVSQFRSTHSGDLDDEQS
jgi:hypothetical protein